MNNNNADFIETIKNECGQFLIESGAQPLFKQLPKVYNNFKKVKVRRRKKTNMFSQFFNNAFKSQINDLRERAVFTNNISSKNVLDNNQLTESFYIFPIDGYNYLYNKEIMDSTTSCKETFDSIMDQLGEDIGQSVFTELLQFTYMSENLEHGITNGSEIIIYSIPYYYALRESTMINYDALFNHEIVV